MKRKSKSKYNTTVGKLMFILPIIIIGSLVVYAFVELNLPGTLIIRAETGSCEDGQVTSATNCSLNVGATVNGKSGETPWTVSLAQGNYVVNFTSVDWYYPPASHNVQLTPGTTAYAVAVYNPIVKGVQATDAGFNTTAVTALHGVTPVNFTNPSGSVVVFAGDLIGTVTLQPLQSYSYVFATAGTYNCTIMANGQVTDEVLTVSVT